MVQAVDTSSGLRVRRDGTTAMSSNVYARRARLPRPISMSMLTRPAYPSPSRSLGARPRTGDASCVASLEDLLPRDHPVRLGPLRPELGELGGQIGPGCGEVSCLPPVGFDVVELPVGLPFA